MNSTDKGDDLSGAEKPSRGFFKKPSSMLIAFVLILVGMIFIVGAYSGLSYVYKNKKNFVEDNERVLKINQVLEWVENFYSQNARYPTQDELANGFLDFNKLDFISKYYIPDYDNLVYVYNSAQTFSLDYNLYNVRENAPGDPASGIFGGYSGYYVASPCLRWRAIGLNHPSTNFYGYPPGGIIYTDLNAGEIYFLETEKTEKVILLNNLHQPRMFQISDSNRTQKIIVTNGNDVISYTWNEVGPKLENPQKIGDVPTGCLLSNF